MMNDELSKRFWTVIDRLFIKLDREEFIKLETYWNIRLNIYIRFRVGKASVANSSLTRTGYFIIINGK